MRIFKFLYFKLQPYDVRFVIKLLESEIQKEEDDDFYIFICKQVLASCKEYINEKV